jgi:hypothetical protein
MVYFEPPQHSRRWTIGTTAKTHRQNSRVPPQIRNQHLSNTDQKRRGFSQLVRLFCTMNHVLFDSNVTVGHAESKGS